MKSSPATARKPERIRCLVIQLARLGDTLQTLMALRAAQELYPNLEIHVVARERFAAGLKRVSWIKNVHTLPTDKFLSPILRGDKSELDGVRQLAGWIKPLAQHPWDLIVNWTYSDASSYLTAILPGRIKLGYSRNKKLEFTCVDGWSHYIQAVVQGGVDQSIHLTDILTTQLLTALQIHFGEPAATDAAVTSRTFFSTELDGQNGVEDLCNLQWGGRDGTRRWMAIQLGAAQVAKTWSPENWGKLASLVLKRHPDTRFVLLGGAEDSARAHYFLKEIERAGHPPTSVLNLVGQTGFDLWTSVLSGCQWLFSGDTAAIHLASILGTRVMNISVGPVKWAETGPYGHGHYVVSTNRVCKACETPTGSFAHSCRQDVSPEAVYGAWSYATAEWTHRGQLALDEHFTQLGWSGALSTVRIHRARIRSADDGGGIVYEPVTRHPIQFKDWTALAIETIARSWYCGWAPPAGQGLTRERISPALIKKLRELQESTQVFMKVCGEARSTAILLNQRSIHLKSAKVMSLGDRTELHKLAEKLHKLDGLIERLGKTHLPLKAFAQMAKVLMHNLPGDQLAELGKEAASCYGQLADGAALLDQWLKATLSLARPVAIASRAAAAEGPKLVP